MIPIRDTIPCENTPIVTWTLIGVNIVLFLLLKLLNEPAAVQILHLYGLVPARYFHPEWAAALGYPAGNYLPFLSNMFLHAGWSHLLFNIWLIWIFADNIEDVMGKPRFLMFYLICGLVAGLVHMTYNPGSQMPTVGASGAIAGVLGAYFFLYPYAKIVIWIPILFLPIFIQVPAVAFLGVWVIFQLNEATTAIVVGQAYMDVAWWGHLGGFVAGAVLHRFFLISRKSSESA
ncbi:MAG: rhomboid family intramembrane serine protease [Methylococcales bacterium]